MKRRQWPNNPEERPKMSESDRRIEQLLAALRDDNEALRDHAVASLGQLGAAASERRINRLADEDRGNGEAARQAVVQVGDDGVPALLEALRDDDWAVREQAAEALGSLKNERAIDPLIATLKDRDGAVRQAAVLALEKLRDPRAVDGLIEALLDQTVREEAARALKKIPDPRAVDGLLRGLASGNWIVKRPPAEGSGLIGDKRALDGLREALRDEDWLVRDRKSVV